MLYGLSWDWIQAFAVTNRQLMACLPKFNYNVRCSVCRTEKQREIFFLIGGFFLYSNTRLSHNEAWVPTIQLKLLLIMRLLSFCSCHSALSVKSSCFIRTELSLIGAKSAAVPGACCYALFIKSVGCDTTARAVFALPMFRPLNSLPSSSIYGYVFF
jgi:hypothetical protein